MRFQLCSRDEYGSTAILGTKDDAAKLMKQAKVLVNEENTNNPLTLDEQMRDWEVCVVDFVDKEGEIIENAYYAGLTPSGKHCLYLVKDNEVEEYLIKDVDVNMKVYIGKNQPKSKGEEGESLYASRPQARQRNTVSLISDLNDAMMEDKLIYFIKKIK